MRNGSMIVRNGMRRLEFDRSEADVVPIPRREQVEQALALGLDGASVARGERLLERSDDERGRAAARRRDPARSNEAIDEDRALHDPVAAEQAEVPPGGQDPRPVGVAEERSEE